MLRSVLALLTVSLLAAFAAAATSVSPTTYTVSGAIVTFEPTTWASAVPTYASGSIEAVSDYFKTYTSLGSAATGSTGAVDRAASAANPRAVSAVQGFGLVGLVGLVGGLVGALAVW